MPVKKIYNRAKEAEIFFVLNAAVGFYIFTLLMLFLLPIEFSSYKREDAFAIFWYVVTETGSVYGAVTIIILIFVYLKFISKKFSYRIEKFFFFVLLVSAILTVISVLSHFLWKDLFMILRPNMILLNATESFDLNKINPFILNVWQRETGYSFPSGHSQTSFFLGTITSFIFYKTFPARMKLFSLIPLAWASLVCLSRVVIGVHYPADIAGGGLTGLLISVIILLSPVSMRAFEEDKN